jgi:hypothetical protein
VPVLGKSDNAAAARRGNPSRDPTRPFGDTPAGEYACAIGRPGAVTAELERKYGPHGWIALDPIAGQALQAKRNGRFGLLIHGGALNAKGRLRPTHGCIRMFNPDLAALLRAVAQFSRKGELRCRVEEQKS